MNQPSFNPNAVLRLSDNDLSALIETASEELKRRACEAADPQALTEAGFTEGFSSKGEPRRPWLVSGVLICPGWLASRSALAHTCSFVKVGEHWAWEAPDKLHDEVRNIAGAHRTMRSITLLAVSEGVEIDQVLCRTRNAVHEMQRVHSYVVRGGELELVTTRTPKIDRVR